MRSSSVYEKTLLRTPTIRPGKSQVAGINKLIKSVDKK